MIRKLKLIIVFLILSVLSINIQAQIHDHEFMLPPNSVLFPTEETGYDWQCNNETQLSIWVGVAISEFPNKLGNYSYSIYMTSNTFDDNDNILDLVVADIDILYYSHTQYLQQRSDEKGLLQSKQDFKQQMIKEVDAYENKGELLNGVEDFTNPTLLITHDPILVHTFFLPDRESDIVVIWGYIKKLQR